MVWLVIVLIALSVIVAVIYYIRRSKAIAVKKKQPGGVAYRKAAEAIPVYGTFVKAAGIVGKPVNTALHKWTGYHITALNHIPIAGKYLAAPLKYSQSGVKKLNDWLGL